MKEDDLDDFVITVGQEELNGVLYNFERLTGEDDVLTFYFHPDTDEWIALKTEDTMMYIHEIRDVVEDSVFVIPKDFEEIPL